MNYSKKFDEMINIRNKFHLSEERNDEIFEKEEAGQTRKLNYEL